MDSSLSQSPCSGPQTSAKVSEKDPNLENYPSADPLGSGTSLFSPKKMLCNPDLCTGTPADRAGHA